MHAMVLLQVKAGTDALTIKRKYKELAVALHPDKCKVSSITCLHVVTSTSTSAAAVAASTYHTDTAGQRLHGQSAKLVST